MTGVRRILGSGGYHTGEKWLVSTPVNRRAGSKLAVICHGAGSDAWYYGDLAARFRFTNMLARSGMVSIAADLGSVTEGSRDGWGNPTQVARINEAITWAATEWGCDTTRVWLLGDSAGGAGALNWARQNPNRVGAIALRAGVPDIDAIYLDGTGNGLLVALIDQAYGAGGITLPGTSGIYASTPDHASLDITGDLDVRVDVSATDWTPGATQVLASKWTSAGDQRGWQFGINTAGTLFLTIAPGGVNPQLGHSSTVAPTVANGARLAVRVTIDVDNGAAGRSVRFYTAPRLEGTWTQLGSTVTVAGVVAIHGGTAPVEIGSHTGGTAGLFAGIVHAAQLRDGIDGTVVTNPNFTAHASGTTGFVDAIGRTWAINGGATITPGWAYLSADHNPADNTGELSPIADRIRFYYSTDDGLVPPASTVATAAAIGCELVSLGAVDHDPYPTFPDAQAAAWFWSKT